MEARDGQARCHFEERGIGKQPSEIAGLLVQAGKRREASNAAAIESEREACTRLAKMIGIEGTTNRHVKGNLTLHDALVIAEQISSPEAVAHDALLTLRLVLADCKGMSVNELLTYATGGGGSRC
jgi:hypothetical protein